MLANEEAGCVVDHTYNYAANYYNVVEIEHPERGLVAAQMPKLTEDAPLTRVMVTNRSLDAQKYICASSEHKEECVAFLDALYLDDVEFMMSNGIEGKGYNLNDKGYPVITDIEYNADASVEDKRCMRLYQFETESDSDLDYILTSKYCYGVQPECVKLYVQCSYASGPSAAPSPLKSPKSSPSIAPTLRPTAMKCASTSSPARPISTPSSTATSRS